MLAYNKNKLNAWMNRKMVEDAAELRLISETERSVILEKYPSPFFSPGTIVRVGLGLATLIAVTTFLSLIQLILGINFGDFISYFLYGSAVVFLLEFMIRKKSHFRSGVDDLLLYMGLGIIMIGVVLVLDRALDPQLAITVILTLLALLAAIRYADRLIAGLAFIAFIMFTYFLLVKIKQELWIFVPLFTLIISLTGWFGASQMVGNPRWLHYRHCFEFIQGFSLITAGACSNYYVISEVWFDDFHQTELSGFWKIFFITTTVLIPLATIITGFTQKDKKRIRIGALMVVASVMTIHYFLTTTPAEILCILYGSLLLLISYWLLKHYKAKENSISFSERQDSKAFFEVESLLIGAGVGMIIPENTGGRFGGGSFGGAGSGASY